MIPVIIYYLVPYPLTLLHYQFFEFVKELFFPLQKSLKRSDKKNHQHFFSGLVHTRRYAKPPGLVLACSGCHFCFIKKEDCLVKFPQLLSDRGRT